jgi:beta-galactosidase
MIDNNVSFSIYMLHGGTTFGYMNGANWTGDGYRPDVTNYDYDSAIDEAGRLTPKWHMMREAILSRCPDAEKVHAPAPIPMISIPKFELTKSGSLFSQLPKPAISERTMSFEDMGFGTGFALYRTTIDNATNGNLELTNLQDRALVYVDEQFVGSIERRLKQTSLPVSIPAGGELLILVENLGRINFGGQLVTEKKGMDGAKLAGTPIFGWENFALPLDKPLAATKNILFGPSFYRAKVQLSEVGDTYLDMSGWTKGVVWVNGHNLGRYWKIGAQQALFVPGCWLRKGANQVVVFELENAGSAAISGGTQPIWKRE